MVVENIVSIIISTGNFYAIWLILTLSLNYEYGYGGLLNFGKVFFFSIGAFVTGYVAANLANFFLASQANMCTAEAVQLRIDLAKSVPSFAPLSFLISIVLGALLAGAFGYLLSSLLTRIREGFVLGIVLLAAGESSRIIVRNYEPIACGYHGIVGIPNPFIFAGDAELVSYLLSGLIWVVAGITFYAMHKLTKSPYGRMLKSIRENEMAAESFGKDVRDVRKKVLFIGSSLAGVAGVLYAYYIGFVAADDFTSLKTFDIWVAMMLGGVGNHGGAAAGALVVTLIDRGTRTLRGWLATFNFPIELIYLRWVLVGLIMLLILLYRPGGIFPEGRVKTPAYDLFRVKGETS
ncbi:MAG: branched-chain amino acid ABC transporter permease [Candidatus Caldarchaeum sp.]|nr:branched-chain amino acid ABC transporter permease [Candidatus Caldarchaeum sp.]